MKRTLGIIVAGILFSGSLALAQPGPGGAGFGGRQAQDPQQFQRQLQQTLSDNLKQEMGASDEEWTVLWPKIQKVQELQTASGGGFASMASGMRMFARQMGGGGGRMANLGAMLGNSEYQSRMQDLDKALQNPQATDAQIKQLLDAARQARDRAKTQLAAARKELTDLCTARQEAVLFQMGILE
jgi:hypothetical protein